MEKNCCLKRTAIKKSTVFSCPAASLPEVSPELTSLLQLISSSWLNYKLKRYSWDYYLAGDVRGHGWWRLRVGVGILGHEAWVMGGDAAESMSSCRGHLEETVSRISHQYVTQCIKGIYNASVRTNQHTVCNFCIFCSCMHVLFNEYLAFCFKKLRHLSIVIQLLVFRAMCKTDFPSYKKGGASFLSNLKYN